MFRNGSTTADPFQDVGSEGARVSGGGRGVLAGVERANKSDEVGVVGIGDVLAALGVGVVVHTLQDASLVRLLLPARAQRPSRR